jgi:hypothetical protein
MKQKRKKWKRQTDRQTDFLIETSSQRKEINWNKMSSFYPNNNSSLMDAFHNAKSLNF